MSVGYSGADEYISLFLTAELQKNFTRHSPFAIVLPGLETSLKSPQGSYPIKNMSEAFKGSASKGGVAGKTQYIPRQSSLVATDRVAGTSRNYQSITVTKRPISINIKKEISIKFSQFDTDFMNLPIAEQHNVVKQIAEGMNEDFHTNIAALVTTATQATYNGSNIGSPTTVPTLNLYASLNNCLSEKNLPAGDPKYLFLNPQQQLHMAKTYGYDSLQMPSNALGERGVQQYENGRVLKPTMGIQTIETQYIATGSQSTSTYNYFINGNEKIGVGFGHSSGIKRFIDEETSEEKIYYELEYGIFLLDERCVFRVELQKNP